MPPRSTLEICKDIRATDRKRAALEAELYAATGKLYDEFIEGMRRLLAPLPESERN